MAWVSVVIVLKMFYGERGISFYHTQHRLWLYTLSVDQNQAKEIVSGIMIIAKYFTKKHL